MTVLDIKCLLDVDRYKRVRVDAETAIEVYPDGERMAPANNTDFLKRCQKQIKVIKIADQTSGRLIARLESGKLAWIDHQAFDQAIVDPDVATGLALLAPASARAEAKTADQPVFLDRSQTHTLGRCGRSGDPADQERSATKRG